MPYSTRLDALSHSGWQRKPFALFRAATLAYLLAVSAAKPNTFNSRDATDIEDDPSCHPPLPNLLAHYPPKANDSSLAAIFDTVDAYLEKIVAVNNTDSISVSIVTSGGPLYAKGFGIARANETDPAKRLRPDGKSIYRVASVSKLFTTLETHILRERGVLNWDDPVKKYIPQFSPPGKGWISQLEGVSQTTEESLISLRQLSSHFSGLPRDLPTDAGQWPWKQIPSASAPSQKAEGQSMLEQALSYLSSFPLASKPNNFPIYSNVGFGLLGLVNIIANVQASKNKEQEPQTHADLLKRDIFDPLGLDSTFFSNPSPDQRGRIAVPNKDTGLANMAFNDVENASGGQFSSAADLGRVLTSFLSPTGNGSVIRMSTMDEWVKPLYSWSNRPSIDSPPNIIEQVGAPWEIRLGANGEQVYTKSGDLPGYYSNMAMVPNLSVGIIVLRTGASFDNANIVLDILALLQQFLVERQRILLREYTGTWMHGEDVAEIQILPQFPEVLTMTKLVVDGVDVLALGANLAAVPSSSNPEKKHQVALWYTGHIGEFRIAFGKPSLSSADHPSCLQYWALVDGGLRANGIPVDLIYWHEGRLVYPSAGVRFEKAKSQ